MALGPLLTALESPYGRTMDDILILPTGPLAEASLALARSSESRPIADHSIRSFLFARLLADHEGCLNDAAYDEDLLFAATVMHDLGLGEHAQGQARFEVEGADLAAGVLRKHGVADADVDKVWEAIALHACIGIADRRGLLTYLTHRGVFMDIGRHRRSGREPAAPGGVQRVPATRRRSLHRRRDRHARGSVRAAAPRGSLAAELLREHREMNRRT